MEICDNEEINVFECSCDCNSNKNNNCDLNRNELLNQIMEYDFVLQELGLFLNTHPNCEKALAMHNDYANKVKKMKDNYQKIYGPLTMNYPCNSWRWGQGPWPWERGF